MGANKRTRSRGKELPSSTAESFKQKENVKKHGARNYASKLRSSTEEVMTVKGCNLETVIEGLSADNNPSTEEVMARKQSGSFDMFNTQASALKMDTEDNNEEQGSRSEIQQKESLVLETDKSNLIYSNSRGLKRDRDRRHSNQKENGTNGEDCSAKEIISPAHTTKKRKKGCHTPTDRCGSQMEDKWFTSWNSDQIILILSEISKSMGKETNSIDWSQLTQKMKVLMDLQITEEELYQKVILLKFKYYGKVTEMMNGEGDGIPFKNSKEKQIFLFSKAIWGGTNCALEELLKEDAKGEPAKSVEEDAKDWTNRGQTEPRQEDWNKKEGIKFDGMLCLSNTNSTMEIENSEIVKENLETNENANEGEINGNEVNTDVHTLTDMPTSESMPEEPIAVTSESGSDVGKYMMLRNNVSSPCSASNENTDKNAEIGKSMKCGSKMLPDEPIAVTCEAGSDVGKYMMVRNNVSAPCSASKANTVGDTESGEAMKSGSKMQESLQQVHGNYEKLIEDMEITVPQTSFNKAAEGCGSPCFTVGLNNKEEINVPGVNQTPTHVSTDIHIDPISEFIPHFGKKMTSEIDNDNVKSVIPHEPNHLSSDIVEDNAGKQLASSSRKTAVHKAVISGCAKEGFIKELYENTEKLLEDMEQTVSKLIKTSMDKMAGCYASPAKSCPTSGRTNDLMQSPTVHHSSNADQILATQRHKMHQQRFEFEQQMQKINLKLQKMEKGKRNWN